MLPLLEELRKQGFEIVSGENGEDLVKMLFSTGESEVTSCVYVDPEIAKRVIDGEITPNFDTDGVTIKPVEEKIDEKINETEEETNVEGTKYFLTEVSFFNESGQQFQMVTLSDENGDVIDRKQGSVDEKVLMEVNGQPFEYTFVGISEDGEPTKTTIVLTTGSDDNPVEEATETQSEDIKPQINQKSTKLTEKDVLTEEIDKNIEGQKYCLTEETVVNESGQQIQMVTLSDENGLVLDQKQGLESEHVLMEINDQPFEYVFMGESEDGQPLKTTIVLTSSNPEDEVSNRTGQDDSERENEEEMVESEAGITAANWCPPGIDLNIYTILRHQTEVLVQVKCPPDPLGKPLYYPDTTQQRQQKRFMEIALNYRCGESRGETEEKYNILRDLARVYRLSTPNARPFTKYEVAINEASSQICRFQPSMLFNKPELFKLAREIVEMVRMSLQEAGYPDDILSNKTPATMTTKDHQVMPNKTNDGRKVSKHLASSQLAMLESKGLSSDFNKGDLSSRSNVMHMEESNMDQSQDLPMEKRQTIENLTQRELDAIRLAAIKTLPSLEKLEIKYKVECSELERSFWELANEMMKTTQNKSIATEREKVEDLMSPARIEAVKDASVIYVRSQISSNTTSGSRQNFLTPFEMACNHAASLISACMPSLLTNRTELMEYSKKIVRSCGLNFPHTPNLDRAGIRLFCADQIPELDLSAAEQILLDPVDPFCNPDAKNKSAKGESDSSDDIESLDLSCDEGENYIDDVTIFTLTGTDSLKRIRILDVSNNLFTGIIPFHVNSCCNLVELNLMNNSLRSFPRCIHLPNLQILNIKGNPKLLMAAKRDSFKCLPLIEQFPKIKKIEVDDEMVPLLRKQSLAYLCPNLDSINKEKFDVEPSSETIKTASSAKSLLNSFIFTKWEEDLSGFFKKGISRRDMIRILETFVLYIQNQSNSPNIPEPFLHCQEVLTRRIAEEFLSPKIIEGDDEESAAYSSSRQPEGQINGKGDSNGTVQLTDANSNPILIPEEPLELLNKVIGKAVRQGKTVVYSVMRTAARQPNGELIPVGSSNAGKLVNQDDVAKPSSHVQAMSETEETSITSELDHQAMSIDDQSIQISQSPDNSQIKSSKLGHKHKSKTSTNRSSSGMEISSNASVDNHRSPIISTQKHFRDNFYLPQQKPKPDSNLVINSQSKDSDQLNNPVESDYIENDQPAKSHKPWQPGKRGRPPGTHTKKRTDQDYEIDPEELKKDIIIPKAREDRNLNTNMSLRDSNKNKRFSAYGALDAEALKQGKKDALYTAKFICEDEETGEHYKSLNQETTLSQKKRTYNRQEFGSGSDSDYSPPSKFNSQTPRIIKQENFSKELNEKKILAQRQSQQQILEQQKLLLSHQQATKAGATTGVYPYHNQKQQITSTPSHKIGRDHIAPSQLPPASAVVKKPVMMGNHSPALHSASMRNLSGNSSLSNLSVMEVKSRNSNIDLVNKYSALSYFNKLYGGPDNLRTIVDAAVIEDQTLDNICLSNLGKFIDYDPLHFIRCHARDNDPLDSQTKVWRCVFEPDPVDPQHLTTSVVATCGGECVCLIDCCTGKVMKRFKHVGEEFYVVAWTTIQMSATHRSNLLAAAGRLKEIRLLHPDQLVCYAELKGHTDEISCMIFHPEEPTILFSGDSKAQVLVWDIGVPSGVEYSTKHSLLMRLMIPRADLNPVLNLVFLTKYSALLAGCEDGVFAWTLDSFKRNRIVMERDADIELKIPTRKEPCFDGLSKISENLVAVKCVDEGEIYILNYGQIVLRMLERNSALTRPVLVDVLGQVKWSQTDEIYINCSSRPGLSTLICGDEKGTIWLYDLKPFVKQAGQLTQPFRLNPSKILEWPECSVGAGPSNRMNENSLKNPVVNTTDISSNGEYLVAVTDNNLVCIWKFSGF